PLPTGKSHLPQAAELESEAHAVAEVADGTPPVLEHALPNNAATPAASQPAGESMGWRRIITLGLSLLWLGSAGFLLARWLCGWLFLERLRRTAVPVQGMPSQVFQTCQTQLALRRPVTLASHVAVGSPLTIGLYRPLILVPPSW